MFKINSFFAALFCLLFSLPSFAQKFTLAPTCSFSQDWAKQKTDDLLDHCLETPRKAWLKKYEETEHAVFTQLDDMGDCVSRIDINTPLADIGEVLFPQVLPEVYPQGNFMVCEKIFDAYHLAKTAADGKKQIEPLRKCYGDHFHEARLRIRTRLLDCLGQLKD